MAIDRKLWQRAFRPNCAPELPCPRCRNATLTIVKDSFRDKPDASSQRESKEEYWDDSLWTGVFSCLFECTRPECKEVCAASGRYDVGDGDFGEPVAQYHLRSVVPALPLIQVPSECPQTITDEIKKAFSLFWVDDGACLNRIRTSIELLLNAMKVRVRGTGNKGELTLHARIEKLLDKYNAPKKDPITNKQYKTHQRITALRKTDYKVALLCGQILALKHLGNAGSHPGDVTKSDVFDGFEILEEILHHKYDPQYGQVDRTATKINKRKGR